MYAGFHFWWPKLGFHTTFLIQHWLGVEGMPRRYADHLPEDGFTLYNQISSIGSLILGLSLVPFVLNVYRTWKYAPLVTVDDPLGLRRIPGRGHLLPTAAAQLHHPAPDPLRTPRFRPAPPRDRRPRHPTTDHRVLDQLLGEPDLSSQGTPTNAQQPEGPSTDTRKGKP